MPFLQCFNFVQRVLKYGKLGYSNCAIREVIQVVQITRFLANLYLQIFFLRTSSLFEIRDNVCVLSRFLVDRIIH